MLSVRSLSVCPVCLSVTFVHSGQTVGRIKTKLETQVGLGPGHIVLDGDGTQLPSPKGAQPPIFVPYLLRPNGCMDKDVTWYGARPRPRRLCVRWGPRSPSPKSAHVYCGQTAGLMKLIPGMEVGLSPGDFVLDGDPVLPPQQRGRSPLQIFGPFLFCPNG